MPPIGGRLPAPRTRRGGNATSNASTAADVASELGGGASRWGRNASGLLRLRWLRRLRVGTRGAGRLLRPAGRLLKRVPVLGSLIGLGLGIAGSAAIASDKTLTRDQKNAAHGRNWGSVIGAAGFGALGAALGTAIAPGLGTAIGGVLGGVVGDWLGGNLGEMIGKRFSAFMAPLQPIFNEIKVWALGTWDWIRDGASDFFAKTSRVFAGVGDWITDKWQALVDTVTGVFDSFVGSLKTILNALKDVPVLGDAIRAAETAAKAVAATAGAVADKAGTVASEAYDSVKGAAGKVYDGSLHYIKSRIPKGLKDRVARERALETAANYQQGNIAGLDDAHTRELVASTALTESGGGKLDVVNSAGYMGRYQAGAGWLANAGLIKGGHGAVRAAMARDGFKSEYKWGQSGGMTRFLSDDRNWNDGMSRAKYLASASAQDKAFRTNSDLNYAELVRRGAIKPSMSQAQVAGLLKTSHIAGVGGAVAVARGGAGGRDANGTTGRKYFDDMAGKGAAFAGAFGPKDAAPPATVAAATQVPAVAAPAAASLRVPAAPAAPRLAVVADAPPVHLPMGSGNGSRKPIVVQNRGDAGQDVRDRGIAHIATGGLARGG
jgi:hypothetical protein